RNYVGLVGQRYAVLQFGGGMWNRHERADRVRLRRIPAVVTRGHARNTRPENRMRHQVADSLTFEEGLAIVVQALLVLFPGHHGGDSLVPIEWRLRALPTLAKRSFNSQTGSSTRVQRIEEPVRQTGRRAVPPSWS